MSRIGGALPAPDGILVVDKPLGKTSHDVVAVVRRASHVRRVGHAGTLDPLATGVLVLCLGSATRVSEELRAGDKQYDAVVRFGQATSTYDAEGEPSDAHDISDLTRDRLEEALEAYRGPILQRPPMHSAVHFQGRRLYALARSGIEADTAPRAVTVREIEAVDWRPPDLSLRLTVSGGTYVRSIAHDLGQDLGVGAHLALLRRTAVGRFTLEQAKSLSDTVEALEGGWWPLLIHPTDAALTGMPALVVGSEAESDIRHGRPFSAAAPEPGLCGPARAYAASGCFLAVVRWDADTGRWRPERVFVR